jgi:hypothetical protein
MNSRGKYRLEDGIVYAPGHPPVPLENIQAVDRELWDRKGIAYVDYDLGAGKAGQFKLDDFIYEREPVDQIFAAIEATVLKDHAAPIAPEPQAKRAPVAKAAVPAPVSPVKPAVAQPQPIAAPAKPIAPKPAAPAPRAPSGDAPKAPPATAPLPRPKFAPGPRTGLPPKFPPPRPPQT